jgi:hypothetical protein
MAISCAGGLQHIRGFRRCWSAAVLFLVATVALYYLTPWPLFVRERIVLAGVGAYAAATLLVIFVKCPRCGHLFHNLLGFNNPFSRACSGCGLSLGDADQNSVL